MVQLLYALFVMRVIHETRVVSDTAAVFCIVGEQVRWSCIRCVLLHTRLTKYKTILKSGFLVLKPIRLRQSLVLRWTTALTISTAHIPRYSGFTIIITYYYLKGHSPLLKIIIFHAVHKLRRKYNIHVENVMMQWQAIIGDHYLTSQCDFSAHVFEFAKIAKSSC